MTGKAVGSLFDVFTDLAAGMTQSYTFNWLVTDPTDLPETLIWTATAHVDGGDPEMRENNATAEVAINAAPTPVDVSISQFEVPRNVKSGETEDIKVSVLVSNNSTEPASGSVSVTANGESVFTQDFNNLQVGESLELVFEWTAPIVTRRTNVNWLATIEALGDSDPANNSASDLTRVVPRR